MDKQAFQVQRMLANELDHYKEKGNFYVNSNVKIAEGRLNFYFSFSFSIYFLFLELGLGLSDKDHAVT